MRIFGSKVIALEKKQSRGKFEPKGKEYTLVGYSQESKAYRLWIPGTKTIIKRRDVRFIENLNRNGNETVNNFEVILDPSWNKLTDESTTTPEVNKEVNVQPERDEENTEEDEVVQTDTPKISKRGPGRPSLLKTGKRGRPRKIYNDVKREEEPLIEPSNLKEIEYRTDRQA